jgi:hypothetical protein
MLSSLFVDAPMSVWLFGCLAMTVNECMAIPVNGCMAAPVNLRHATA